jgi:hypothetical protein
MMTLVENRDDHIVSPPDLIVDHSYDELSTLKAWGTVSKSWVPRARRHLFFRVEFRSTSPIELWDEGLSGPLQFSQFSPCTVPRLSSPRVQMRVPGLDLSPHRRITNNRLLLVSHTQIPLHISFQHPTPRTSQPHLLLSSSQGSAVTPSFRQ